MPSSLSSLMIAEVRNELNRLTIRYLTLNKLNENFLIPKLFYFIATALETSLVIKISRERRKVRERERDRG